MKPETNYAKSGDVYIAYQVNGSGPFDLVWAPGTFSHLDMDWEFPMRADFFLKLGTICRLIRFDKRGTGLSDRPTQMATLEQRTDDIRAVMDAVGLESAVIFGVSEGASMACLFAATYPERTRSLITWGGMARWCASEDHPWGLNMEQYAEMIRDVRENWPSEWYIRGPGAGLGPDAPQDVIDHAKRYMRAAGSPSAVAAYETMNSEIDIRPILSAIKVPTLIMNRTGDPAVNVEGARDMAKRIPGARFIEYPGNTHSIMAIEPEKIIGDIQEFVTGVRQKSSTIAYWQPFCLSISLIPPKCSVNLVIGFGRKNSKVTTDSSGLSLDTIGATRQTPLATESWQASTDRRERSAAHLLSLLKSSNWGSTSGLGVHTGEVQVMGDNIGGIAVHIASRVQSESAPGEVLVSSTTKDLIAGSGISFQPRGERNLKGVPGRVASSRGR